MPYDLTKPLFVTATTAEALLSGMILSISLIGIPTLLQNTNEANILRQWRFTFKQGASTAPPFALIAAAASLGGAYTHYHPQASYRSWMLVGSAMATIGIVPFTLTAMKGTNDALHSREEAARVKAEKDGGSPQATEETTNLIKRWRVLNAVRGLLPLVGSLLAFEAL
ncbi:MAG: hypothetical protein Q9159_002848 [Coniocarpon cinnabarinum]